MEDGLTDQEKKIKYGIQLIQEGYNEKVRLKKISAKL
jgi:hypothetical protein